MLTVGTRVKIISISDAPFPSKIGECGTIEQVFPCTTGEYEHLYDVRLDVDGIRYACFENEIDVVDRVARKWR